MVLGNTGRGGAQSFAVNVLRNIDREKYQVDFAVVRDPKNGYGDEIRSYGSKVHKIPKFKIFNWLSFVKKWRKLCSEYHYDVIHGHVSSSAAIYLKVAKKYSCATILHSHSAGYRGNTVVRFIKKIFTKNAKKYADYWFTCSDKAAIRVFGEDCRRNANYYEIPNAILVKNYLFQDSTRKEIRARYHITDEAFLCGHVGSFSAPKNHFFLLDIFKQILIKRQNAVLMLAGEGALLDSIKKYAHDLGIANKIIFTGNVGNVNELLMAMDIMIFPSLFEGLPVTLVEAQASGLPIVASDTITKEIYLSQLVHFYSLEKSAEEWAEQCVSLQSVSRKDFNAVVEQTKYDMKNSIVELSNLYKKMSERGIDNV